MDEATQQAVQIGVNVFIFVLALSLGLTLLFEVREIAETSFEYNASIPTGSRTVAVESVEEMIISGTDLLSYVTNYMTDKNHPVSEKYDVKIKTSGGTTIDKNVVAGLGSYTLEDFLEHKGAEIDSEYKVIITGYDEVHDIVSVELKEI